MRWLPQIFLLSFPSVFLIFNAGCASLPKYTQYSDAPAAQLFLSSAPNFEDSAYSENWVEKTDELDKIRYLLERIAFSKYLFIRNGEVHDGRMARRWLLYKMKHWVSDVDSAADFVRRVASFSQKTGHPYLVEFPDGQLYSLGSILQNELSALEIHVAKLRSLRQQAAPAPGQVSISPTVVATSTVAHSTSQA